MKKMIVSIFVLAFVVSTASVFAKDVEVVVTKTGTKYHKEECRLIKNKDAATKMDKDEALEDGYEPCRKCFKEDLVEADDSGEEAPEQIEKTTKKSKN